VVEALTAHPRARKHRARFTDGDRVNSARGYQFADKCIVDFQEGFMPVTALSPVRPGRHVPRAAGSGRVTTIRRPAADAPALTLTLSIPLAGDALTPQAYRLIEAVRDLVETNQGTVTMAPVQTLDAVEPAEPVEPAAPGSGPVVQLMTASRQVVVDGEVLPLTRLEFDLLMFLAENPRRVFTRAQLLTGVWGYDHTGERTVDVHVRRLRVKLGNGLPLITTVYGVGYRLSDDAHVVIRPHD
jgi:two-component system, OmpR family, response regulator